MYVSKRHTVSSLFTPKYLLGCSFKILIVPRRGVIQFLFCFFKIHAMRAGGGDTPMFTHTGGTHTPLDFLWISDPGGRYPRKTVASRGFSAYLLDFLFFFWCSSPLLFCAWYRLNFDYKDYVSSPNPVKNFFIQTFFLINYIWLLNPPLKEL